VSNLINTTNDKGHEVTGNAHFDDWIRPHLGALMRIARAFAEPADQHDLMQELMISAWKAMPAFRGEAAASTFGGYDDDLKTAPRWPKPLFRADERYSRHDNLCGRL
jgi:hypothetical protein